MHPALSELVALLAPPACAACGRALPRALDRLCHSCTRALPWLGNVCPRCALPRHRHGRCPAAALAFGRAWAPMAYEGVARDLVVALKFRSRVAVADLMAAQMAANLPPALRLSPASVVPVPALPARHRRRGFDPAGVLAAALARRLSRPLAGCLARADRAGRQ